MELLEREAALAALTEARDAAARGDGRVVVVTGEPGIGKTSLVTRFLADLGADARVLLGTCDDLSIPRPLGAIRDLAGTLSPALEEALAAGASPHDDPPPAARRARAPAAADGARARGRALGRRGDARRDHRARAADRLAARAARAHVPGRRGAAGPPGARDRVRRRLERRRARRPCRRARSPRSPATPPRTSTPRPAATRSTSPSCSPRARRTSCRARSRTRSSAAPRGCRRGARAWWSSSRWCRTASPRRYSTRSCPAGRRRRRSPSAGSCSRSQPRYVRFRHELARNAIRSSVPIAARRRLHAEILEALLAADADPADIVHHAEAAGAEDRRRRLRARRCAAGGGARLEPRGVLPLPARRRRSSTGCPRPSRPPCSRSSRARRTPSTASRRPSPRSSGRSRRGSPSATAPRSAAARGSCPGSTGTRATATPRGRRRSRRSRSSSRSASRSSSPAPTAASPSSRMLAEDNEQALAWGERALELATRLGDERTRAHALVNIGSVQAGRRSPRGRAAPRGARLRRRGRRQARGDARARQPRLRAHVVGAAGAGDALRAAGARLRGAERGLQPRLVHRGHAARGCSCAPASGTRPSG